MEQFWWRRESELRRRDLIETMYNVLWARKHGGLFIFQYDPWFPGAETAINTGARH